MKIHPWINKTTRILWAVFLVSLPISSFPHFPGFFGDTAQVRPLALYPLIFLVIFATLPHIFSRKLPRTLIPFFIFAIAAAGSTVFALTQDIIPPIDVAVGGRVIRTLLTLVIGGMFYLTVSLIPRKKEDLSFTLKWLYVGFGLALLWGSFQIIYVIKFDREYFNLLNEVQSWISSRRLFDKRISGMTYEPSWFAEQISFVLMPFLFASILTNYSVFQWRYKRLTIEMILLGWSFVALLFTYSRTGLAIFGILVVVTMVIGLSRKKDQNEIRWGHWLKMTGQIGIVLLVLGLVIFGVAQRNNYFSRLWDYWTDEESSGSYLYYIAFDQRFAYWETAYRIFEDHPAFGVGLGNFTFYFKEYLPDRQYKNPELLMKLVPDVGRNQIVTVKNFFIRLLAETGLVGTAAFLVYLAAISGGVAYLLLTGMDDGRFWGRAGFLGLVAFFPVTLSIDSFAIPNMWVVFGLITASTFIFQQERGEITGIDD